MLISRDFWLKVQTADEEHLCDGSGHWNADTVQHSPLCVGTIRRGQQFVANVDQDDTKRRVPRVYVVLSRHCEHCALAFFPAVKVGGQDVAA